MPRCRRAFTASNTNWMTISRVSTVVMSVSHISIVDICYLLLDWNITSRAIEAFFALTFSRHVPSCVEGSANTLRCQRSIAALTCVMTLICSNQWYKDSKKQKHLLFIFVKLRIYSYLITKNDSSS